MIGTGGRVAPETASTVAALLLAAAVLGACAADASDPSTGAGATVAHDDLAPSQRTSSTVARPDTPPPCDPAVVEVTSGTSAAGPSVELRLVNGGPSWCEVDLGASPTIDPLMEPDVWLEPGAEAVLLVAAEATCDGSPTGAIDLAVNGAVRAVPVGSAGCGWRLTAFYPADDG